LREAQAFTVYGHRSTLERIAENPVFRVLASVRWVGFTEGAGVALPGGIELEPFAVQGKEPLYLERGPANEKAILEEDGTGFEIRGADAQLLFLPSCIAVTPALQSRIVEADVVFFDGTLFTDTEMIVLGAGAKTGRRMGHLPIDGGDGSLAQFAAIPRKPGQRRIYIHINNTNPVLIAGSVERQRVESAGWEIARDGMRIDL